MKRRHWYPKVPKRKQFAEKSVAPYTVHARIDGVVVTRFDKPDGSAASLSSGFFICNMVTRDGKSIRVKIRRVGHPLPGILYEMRVNTVSKCVGQPDTLGVDRILGTSPLRFADHANAVFRVTGLGAAAASWQRWVKRQTDETLGLATSELFDAASKEAEPPEWYAALEKTPAMSALMGYDAGKTLDRYYRASTIKGVDVMNRVKASKLLDEDPCAMCYECNFRRLGMPRVTTKVLRRIGRMPRGAGERALVLYEQMCESRDKGSTAYRVRGRSRYDEAPVRAVLDKYDAVREFIPKEGERYLMITSLFDAMHDVAECLGTINAFERNPDDEAASAAVADSIMDDGPFNDEQRDAIHLVMNNTISVITGGPGCGKTMLTSVLGKLYRKRLVSVGLAGKVTRKSAEVLGEFGTLCCTIHAVVCGSQVSAAINEPVFKNGKYQTERSTLAFDCIIFEEASTIPLPLLARMLRHLARVQPGIKKIVFVGDPNQLPSIGPGEILTDLIRTLPTATLVTNHRTEVATIKRNLDRILNDDDHFECNPPECNKRATVPPAQLPATLEGFLGGCDVEDFKVLTWTNATRMGVNNAFARKQYGPDATAKDLRPGMPWLCMANNKFAMNGETGIFHSIGDYQSLGMKFGEHLISKKELDDGAILQDTATSSAAPLTSGCTRLFEIYPGQFAVGTRFGLEHFEAGWCLTGHKAIGSEYSRVVVYLPKAGELTKRLRYTMMSRPVERLLLMDPGSASDDRPEEKRVTCLAHALRFGLRDAEPSPIPS
jgi:hypothetical protein